MKIGDKVVCIKDHDYMPIIKKGKTYIIESQYDEIKYNIGSKPTTILHEDILYIMCEYKFPCLFSLVKRKGYTC